MTAPCDPESNPEAQEEEQEIILRLGDILPRVPIHLLKPGPHDAMAPVRFSVEELAEKISRGRVTVPLERIASIYPTVFLDDSAFPGQRQEVPLPLQKLLEQVGLVGPKSVAANGGVPAEQVAEARAEASRIIQANLANPVPEFATAPPVHSVRIAKAISTARQILGLFRGPGGSSAQTASDDKAEVRDMSSTEDESPAQPLDKKPEPSPDVQLSPPLQAPPEPASQSLPAGHISLRALPIFRLLPSSVLRSNSYPSESVRVALPLAVVDEQIASGHVEIPIAEFIKALPGDLRDAVIELPETQVWIPLDEIFQNLPKDHLFYMPPLEEMEQTKKSNAVDPAAVDEPSKENTDAPQNKKEVKPPEKIDEPVTKAEAGIGAGRKPEPSTETAGNINGAEEKKPASESEQESEPNVEGAQETNGSAEEEAPEVAESPSSSPSIEPGSEVVSEKQAEPAPTPDAAISKEAAPTDLPTGSEPIAKAEPATNGSVEPPVAAAEKPSPAEESVPPADTKPLDPPSPPVVDPLAPISAAAASRAPWMRGFQVPPPRLFSGETGPMTPPVTEAESAPVEPPSQAPTPEAKQTSDFLASQPGIFAAAAFVQGAVFASTDFPRRPDLDALRDFMGAFIDRAQDAGRRLGWNRTLTISCEQFYLTAVVRDSHFIVALHHDRMLPPLTHDALVEAADELSKAANAAG